MVTTPADTAIAAPASTDWTVGQGALDRVDIVIPSGHVGLTGIQLLWGARQVAPYEAAEWITGNDDEVTIRLDLWTGLGVITVRTYNTDDTFPHSHHLRAYLSDLEVAEPLVLPPLPLGEIGPAPELIGPSEGPPSGLSPEEEFVVAEVLDQFLADLSAVLDDFLSALQVTLSGVAPEVGPEPPPEEVTPPGSSGDQDGEDHHHHKHGSGPHGAAVSHKRSTAHPGHHHWWGALVPTSDHHPHVHAHADGARH